MTDRNRELVPGSWSRIRKSARTTELSGEESYSYENSSVCRRPELPGRNERDLKGRRWFDER